MSIWQSVRYCIVQKYASGKGRASRSEFCAYLAAFTLFSLFWLMFIAASVDYYGGLNLIDFVLLYIPFLFVPPLIAVTVRRLHDTGKTGWLVFLLFIPFINLFGMALLLLRSERGANRFGAPAPRVDF